MGVGYGCSGFFRLSMLRCAQRKQAQYMSEAINEAVSVLLSSNHLEGMVSPSVLSWRGRRYRIVKVGLHHTVREGRVLFHYFSVTDGATFFRLRFDTETLEWKLLEIDG